MELTARNAKGVSMGGELLLSHAFAPGRNKINAIAAPPTRSKLRVFGTLPSITVAAARAGSGLTGSFVDASSVGFCQHPRRLAHIKLRISRLPGLLEIDQTNVCWHESLLLLVILTVLLSDVATVYHQALNLRDGLIGTSIGASVEQVL